MIKTGKCVEGDLFVDRSILRGKTIHCMSNKEYELTIRTIGVDSKLNQKNNETCRTKLMKQWQWSFKNCP